MISWVLVLALPITVPAAWSTQPAAPVPAASWLGFVYVSLFSMWLGFFAWYRALALGGTVRVSQVQLLQPFLSIVAAVPTARRIGRRRDLGVPARRDGRGVRVASRRVIIDPKPRK